MMRIALYGQMMYSDNMRYEWNPEKNELLKIDRNISFEKIGFHLDKGDVWKITDHHNKDQYPNQKVYFVIVEEYIYMVPFVVEEDYIFLKTVIPSRKATKEYRKEMEINDEI